MYYLLSVNNFMQIESGCTLHGGFSCFMNSILSSFWHFFRMERCSVIDGFLTTCGSCNFMCFPIKDLELACLLLCW